MRLKNYIIEVQRYKKKFRGVELSLDEVIRVSRHYSKAIEKLLKNENSVIMTRTTLGSYFDYKYINPKKEEPRVSANTFNYYTLIIDNSKKWSKYPKRSQSIICLNDSYSTMDDFYYWVVPKNGAVIGECNSRDFWVSFENISSMDDYFNEYVRLFLNFPYIDSNFNDIHIENINNKNKKDYSYNIKLKRFDSNLSEFKKAVKNFDRWWKNQKTLTLQEFKSNFSNISWIKKWNGKESLYNVLEKTLDPSKNGFKIKTIKNIEIDKESWTDAECLIIHYENIEKVLKAYSKKGK
jgi:hypothetical protein